MGANPMQKMKRNSILIGAVIGLMIGLILCGIMYFLLTKSPFSASITGDERITVYMLTKSVKSGEIVNLNDVSARVMNKSDVPGNAVSIPTQVNVIAKIDLSAGTIITSSMLATSTDSLADDTRNQEYNMISLPSQLKTGDFVDIRLQMPNGGDYIVITKKRVIKCNATNLTLEMREEEIDLMSNAIIEYYVMPGSKLYAIMYNEPGIQKAAVGTYVPNASVSKLISNNPNIKELINQERYSSAMIDIRNSDINSALAPYYKDPDGDGKTEALDNIEKNIQEEIKTLKEARETYFETLNSAY